jgi:hypothetical protein
VAYLGLDFWGHQGWTNEGSGPEPSRGSRREAPREEGSVEGATARKFTLEIIVRNFKCHIGISTLPIVQKL